MNALVEKYSKGYGGGTKEEAKKEVADDTYDTKPVGAVQKVEGPLTQEEYNALNPNSANKAASKELISSINASYANNNSPAFGYNLDLNLSNTLPLSDFESKLISKAFDIEAELLSMIPL